MVNNVKNKCAYCGSSKKLTREHIIPKFLYELNEERKIGFNVGANKVIKSEHVIKDVCGKCNNLHLSSLDSYGKNLYISNKLDEHHPPNVKLIFKFEYDLLQRFLLKMAYNASRASRTFTHLFEYLTQYILDGSEAYKTSHIRIFLEIISHYKLSSKQKELLREKSKNTIFSKEDFGDYFYHDKLAVGQGFLVSDTVQSDNNTEPFPGIPMSYITLNSYFFYIIHFEKDLSGQEIDGKIRSNKKFLKYAKRLTKNNLETTIKVSKRNTIHPIPRSSHMSQREAWEKYISENFIL